jgi:hypothetical protein
VVLTREAAVGLLEVLVRSAALDPEDLVIVLVLHGDMMRAKPAGSTALVVRPGTFYF